MPRTLEKREKEDGVLIKCGKTIILYSFYISFSNFWYSFSITYVGLQYISKYSDAINIIILLSPLILTNSLANIGGYILYAPV